VRSTVTVGGGRSPLSLGTRATMSTRTKLQIASYTASAMILLNVFSKPLGITEAFQWVLIIGVFIPLGFLFYFVRQQKLERQAQPASAENALPLVVDGRQNARRRLILMMVLGVAVGLSSPLWLPLTGSTLGTRGDFVCGIITAAIACAIFGFRLKRL
jgi:hypothetical protein